METIFTPPTPVERGRLVVNRTVDGCRTRYSYSHRCTTTHPTWTSPTTTGPPENPFTLSELPSTRDSRRSRPLGGTRRRRKGNAPVSLDGEPGRERTLYFPWRRRVQLKEGCHPFIVIHCLFSGLLVPPNEPTLCCGPDSAGTWRPVSHGIDTVLKDFNEKRRDPKTGRVRS